MKTTAMSNKPNTPWSFRSLRRLCGLGIAAIGLSALIASAQATTIPVTNGNFETEYGSNTNKTINWVKLTSWSLDNTLIGSVPIAGAFSSDADGGSHFTRFTYNDAGAEQDLNRTVAIGDTLSVTFNFGRATNRWGGSNNTGVAYFKIGSQYYYQDCDVSGQTAGTWKSFTFTTTATNAGALSLGFRVARTTANNQYVSLDGVSDVTLTPAANDPNAPSSAGATLAADENVAKALAESDFGYADPNSSPLAAVQITALPALGSLKLSGTAVTLNQIVTVADIGNLSYLSPLGGFGSPYTTIGIKVQNSATPTGLWSLPATMTVNVTHVNHAPTSTGGTVVMRKNTVKTFASTNFPFADVDAGDTFGAIKVVTSLPANGTLKLNGTAITAVPSAAIPVANIGTLTYTPNTDYTGAESFNFQVRDATLFSADATMAITVTPDIPVVNGSFETIGASLGGPWATAAAIWNPNTTYAQTNDNNRFATRTDAGTWYANLTDPGNTFYQNLGVSVNSGDTLAVTFYVGRENGQVGGIMAATFKVGTTSYTQNFDTTGLTAGTWQSYTLTQTIANTGNLILQFSRVSGRPWLDNISNVSVMPFSGTPVITTSGSLVAVNTTYGTASAPPTSFTVSGADMAAGITVTPPAGFEVSQTPGGTDGYAGSGAPITVGSAGTIVSTTIYVRLAATATVGASPYSGNIVCASLSATPQDVATASSAVSPAALTITANHQDKPYGTEQTTPVDYSTKFTSIGLKNGDKVDTVTLTYSGIGVAESASVGATATITPSAAEGSSFDPGNYNIVYVAGTLTVIPAPVITLGGTLGAVSTTYGTASVTPTSFTVSGIHLLLASGNLTVTAPFGYEVSLNSVADYTTHLLLPYSDSTLASTTVYVRLAATADVLNSPYSDVILVAGGEATEKTIATVSSTVSPATLTLTANHQDKPYGTTQPTPVSGSSAFTATGLKNTDTVATVTLTYSGDGLAESAEPGTTATITPSAAFGTFNPDNYTIGYVNGTLTVVKATPTATLAVNNSPVTYNGSAHAASVGITISSVDGTVQNILTDGANDQTNAGAYAVTADFVPTDATHYQTLTAQPAGNFVINKATPTVVVAPYTVPYDGNPHSATVTSITGVNGETGPTVGTVTLNTTHTNTGIYNTDSWYFTGTTNYNNIGGAPSTITVANGGFEDPTPHNPNNNTNADWTAGGWAFLGAPWTSSYGGNYARFSSTPMVGTAQPGPWICNLNGSGIWIKQNLGTSVNAGDILSVTFQLMSDNLPGEVTAEFQIGTGPTVYSQTFTSPQNNGTWVPYTLTQTVGVGVSGNLSLKFSNTGVASVNDRSWLRNVSNVTVTPAGMQTITDTILASVPNTYASWASTNGLSGSAGDGTDKDPAFNADPNKDGVANGLVWLIGGTAGDPLANSHSFLPVPTDAGGKLVMTFQSLKSSARGTANLYVQFSKDLGAGDAWHSAAVPELPGTPGTVQSIDGVDFLVTPTTPASDYNNVTAEIPATAAGLNGKLFGRVKATE